ncbi:MAG: class I SAM-dependent methyltransferase [Microthrixaceae bacterium]
MAHPRSDGTTQDLSEIERLTPTADGWHDEQQVATYLGRVDKLAPRIAGEDLLSELLPAKPSRVLDLGAGDGRLTALALSHRPTIHEAVLLDNSEPMLERARERFAKDRRVRILNHDIRDPIPDLGPFDLIVSGLAVHHLEHSRKRAIFEELFARLNPGGLFANLDVVASATPALHADFLAALRRDADDPEDRLAPIEDQLKWMRATGLANVDCLWRWRGLALMVGVRPELAQ